MTVNRRSTKFTASNFDPVETSIYKAVIVNAIKLDYKGGAIGIQLEAKLFDSETDEEVGTVTDKLFVRSAKGETYFTDDKGNKTAYSGYEIITDIAIMCKLMGPNDDFFSKVVVQDKVVQEWNFDTNQKEPVTRSVFVGMLNKEIYLGVFKRETLTKKKVDTNYIADGGTKDKNTIEYVFQFPTKKTVPEALQKLDPADFDRWLKAYDGKTIGLSKKEKVELATAQATNPTSGSVSPQETPVPEDVADIF